MNESRIATVAVGVIFMASCLSALLRGHVLSAIGIIAGAVLLPLLAEKRTP